LIEYSQRAQRQLFELLLHYEKLDRTEAVRNLIAAMAQVEASIERKPDAGLPAPRPYPSLARLGYAWTKSGSYWVAYSRSAPSVIVGVFHESADIANRV
jgi:plasmid stabilization system protein ParE